MVCQKGDGFGIMEVSGALYFSQQRKKKLKNRKKKMRVFLTFINVLLFWPIKRTQEHASRPTEIQVEIDKNKCCWLGAKNKIGFAPICGTPHGRSLLFWASS
jgi:hypothetical protein